MVRQAAADGSARTATDTGRPRTVWTAIAWTAAATVLWGVAHLAAGRRRVGYALLTIMLLLGAGLAVARYGFPDDLVRLAVRPDLLLVVMVLLLCFGCAWVAVIIRSYAVVRPHRASTAARITGAVVVTALCLLVSVPVGWAARFTYVSQDTLSSIFAGGDGDVDTEDPWNGRRRVNVLLLGGDAAENRVGVRTDSMTLASIDTRSGSTVLLSLPRNLESFPMPPGPARERFPYGFTGDGPLNPGLLNEVYEYAEENPDVVPDAPAGRRGATLIKETIAGILGQPVDYYILVDMYGFADIIDAMGGVRIKIDEPIPYGLRGEVLAPGDRILTGKEALWYGRSRTNSDDYNRMGRQKCLLRAIAKQADAQRVLTQFDKLAGAAKRTISTDIPRGLLPALIDLSQKVKADDAEMKSLQFVPPLIHTGNPDFTKIRRLAAGAIAGSERRADAPAGKAETARPVTAGDDETSGRDADDPRSLDSVC